MMQVLQIRLEQIRSLGGYLIKNCYWTLDNKHVLFETVDSHMIEIIYKYNRFNLSEYYKLFQYDVCTSCKPEQYSHHYMESNQGDKSRFPDGEGELIRAGWFDKMNNFQFHLFEVSDQFIASNLKAIRVFQFLNNLLNLDYFHDSNNDSFNVTKGFYNDLSRAGIKLPNEYYLYSWIGSFESDEAGLLDNEQFVDFLRELTNCIIDD